MPSENPPASTTTDTNAQATVLSSAQLQALAVKVLALLKHELRIERERRGRATPLTGKR